MERELGVVGEAELQIEPAGLERPEEGRVRRPHGQVVHEHQHLAPAGALARSFAAAGDDEEGEEEEEDGEARRRHCGVWWRDAQISRWGFCLGLVSEE